MALIELVGFSAQLKKVVDLLLVVRDGGLLSRMMGQPYKHKKYSQNSLGKKELVIFFYIMLFRFV